MDRLLKSNTSKTRTHSLFRQGCILYDLIPTMPEHRLVPLIENFAEAILNAGLEIHEACAIFARPCGLTWYLMTGSGMAWVVGRRHLPPAWTG